MTMDNRIVNFAVKKITRENARGDHYTLQVVIAFEALYTAGDINYKLTVSLPPPRINSELTLVNWRSIIAHSVRATNPLTPFPIAFTRTAPIEGFCEGVTLIPPCAPLAGPLSARESYPITRVRHSTLYFQTGKQLKVLNLFRGDSIAFGGAYRWNPLFSILNNSVTPLGCERD